MTDWRRDEVLQVLPSATIPLVEALLAVAEARACQIYLVGGPVRDLLLGRPIFDVDMIVEGPGTGLAETLGRAAASDGTRVRTYDRFGTVSLETGEGRVDLANLRREQYRHPGALPKVEPGTLEEDLGRRDFSVNALALPLVTTGRARVKLIDLNDGLRDLADRQLRVLHPRSFHDDPTRALRAARLAPRLGFSLSRGSRSALRDALRDGAFGSVSGDRLRREFEKLFSDARLGLNPAEALKRLAGWHVLAALEPGLDLPKESVPALRRQGRGTLEAPWRGPRHRSWVTGLELWLAPLPVALRRRTLRRFSVRGELAARIGGYPKAREGWLRRLETARGRGAVDALLAGIDEESLYALWADAPTAIRRRVVRWAAEDRGRRSPVGGADLLALGLSGPGLGRALARIRSAFLDGGVANREEGLALGQELARRRGARSGRSAQRPAKRT